MPFFLYFVFSFASLDSDLNKENVLNKNSYAINECIYLMRFVNNVEGWYRSLSNDLVSNRDLFGIDSEKSAFLIFKNIAFFIEIHLKNRFGVDKEPFEGYFNPEIVVLLKNTLNSLKSESFNALCLKISIVRGKDYFQSEKQQSIEETKTIAETFEYQVLNILNNQILSSDESIRFDSEQVIKEYKASKRLDPDYLEDIADLKLSQREPSKISDQFEFSDKLHTILFNELLTSRKNSVLPIKITTTQKLNSNFEEINSEDVLDEVNILVANDSAVLAIYLSSKLISMKNLSYFKEPRTLLEYFIINFTFLNQKVYNFHHKNHDIDPELFAFENIKNLLLGFGLNEIYYLLDNFLNGSINDVTKEMLLRCIADSSNLLNVLIICTNLEEIEKNKLEHAHSILETLEDSNPKYNEKIDSVKELKECSTSNIESYMKIPTITAPTVSEIGLFKNNNHNERLKHLEDFGSVFKIINIETYLSKKHQAVERKFNKNLKREKYNSHSQSEDQILIDIISFLNDTIDGGVDIARFIISLNRKKNVETPLNDFVVFNSIFSVYIKEIINQKYLISMREIAINKEVLHAVQKHIDAILGIIFDKILIFYHKFFKPIYPEIIYDDRLYGLNRKTVKKNLLMITYEDYKNYAIKKNTETGIDDFQQVDMIKPNMAIDEEFKISISDFYNSMTEKFYDNYRDSATDTITIEEKHEETEQDDGSKIIRMLEQNSENIHYFTPRDLMLNESQIPDHYIVKEMESEDYQEKIMYKFLNSLARSSINIINWLNETKNVKALELFTYLFTFNKEMTLEKYYLKNKLYNNTEERNINIEKLKSIIMSHADKALCYLNQNKRMPERVMEIFLNDLETFLVSLKNKFLLKQHVPMPKTMIKDNFSKIPDKSSNKGSSLFNTQQKSSNKHSNQNSEKIPTQYITSINSTDEIESTQLDTHISAEKRIESDSSIKHGIFEPFLGNKFSLVISLPPDVIEDAKISETMGLINQNTKRTLINYRYNDTLVFDSFKNASQPPQNENIMKDNNGFERVNIPIAVVSIIPKKTAVQPKSNGDSISENYIHTEVSGQRNSSNKRKVKGPTPKKISMDNNLNLISNSKKEPKSAQNSKKRMRRSQMQKKVINMLQRTNLNRNENKREIFRVLSEIKHEEAADHFNSNGFLLIFFALFLTFLFSII